jgi:hypothetical protein
MAGRVSKVESESLVGSQNALLAVARTLGLWKRPPLGAVHEMVVQTPDGRARSFR